MTRHDQRTSQDARTRHRDDALDRAIERFQDERDRDADQQPVVPATVVGPPPPASVPPSGDEGEDVP